MKLTINYPWMVVRAANYDIDVRFCETKAEAERHAGAYEIEDLNDCMSDEDFIAMTGGDIHALLFCAEFGEDGKLRNVSCPCAYRSMDEAKQAVWTEAGKLVVERECGKYAERKPWNFFWANNHAVAGCGEERWVWKAVDLDYEQRLWTED